MVVTKCPFKGASLPFSRASSLESFSFKSAADFSVNETAANFACGSLRNSSRTFQTNVVVLPHPAPATTDIPCPQAETISCCSEVKRLTLASACNHIGQRQNIFDIPRFLLWAERGTRHQDSQSNV